MKKLGNKAGRFLGNVARKFLNGWKKYKNMTIVVYNGY